MVSIRLGIYTPLIPYQVALEIEQNLRVACKHAAQLDRAPASSWRQVATQDLADTPRAHRFARRSRLVPNVKRWSIAVHVGEVEIIFDDKSTRIDWADGVKLHQMIRRAGRIAKAWAGDTSKSSRMIGNLTAADALECTL